MGHSRLRFIRRELLRVRFTPANFSTIVYPFLHDFSCDLCLNNEGTKVNTKQV